MDTEGTGNTPLRPHSLPHIIHLSRIIRTSNTYATGVTGAGVYGLGEPPWIGKSGREAIN